MPVRESRDQHSFNSSPELFAVFHALQSLLTPRHPPCALSSLVHINPTLFSIAASLERESAADKKPRLSVVSTYLFSTHASNRARLKRVTLDLKCAWKSNRDGRTLRFVPFVLPSNAKSLGEQIRDQSPRQTLARLRTIDPVFCSKYKMPLLQQPNCQRSSAARLPLES